MESLKFRTSLDPISPYVPGKPIDDVKRELGLVNVIKLASNENPYGCSDDAKKAIIDTLANASLYPDGNCTLLRGKLAQKHSVKSDQLVFGAGSNEIISLIAQIYIDEGDESIMATPSFLWYEIAVRTMNGMPVTVPLKDYTHDLDAMASKITDRTKVIWICNPNNPTGTIVNNSSLLDFLKKVPKGILVVLDEAYYEYVKAQDYPQTIPLLEQYPNLIILRTFSKAYGLASMRIGYAVANPAVAGYLNRVRPPFNVTTPAQAAALASLEDQAFCQKCSDLNYEGLNYLYNEFDKLGLEYIKSNTNFLMVKVNEDGQEVFKKLLAKGVIVRFDRGFCMPEWLRVTVGNMEENKTFINALKEVIKR